MEQGVHLPVCEGAFREAWPAGSAVDEADVEDEHHGKEIVDDGYGDRSADEAPF